MNDVRLIDANALVKDLRLMAKYQDPYKCSTILGVCSTIEAKKTIDAVPVVHGRWVLFGADKRGRGGVYTCTACNRCRPIKSDYCPHCGAKMDGGAR